MNHIYDLDGILTSSTNCLVSVQDNDAVMKGFTLSYLRRVPDLADLARRIVKQKSASHARSQSISARQSVSEYDALLSKNIKRLFQWTILALVQKGEMIVNEGSSYPYSTLTALSGPEGEAKMPWKALKPDSKARSQSSSSSSRRRDNNEGALSEPDELEESYVPVTPEYIALELEKVMGRLIHSVNAREYVDPEKKVAKTATKASIVKSLKRDDRFQYLSEYAVDEALEFLRDDERAVEVERGHWTLCKNVNTER
jgi:hypothetical protein